MAKRKRIGPKGRAAIRKVIEVFEHLGEGIIKIWIRDRSFKVREGDIKGLALDELERLLIPKDEAAK